jgi:hypothetical protein
MMKLSVTIFVVEVVDLRSGNTASEQSFTDLLMTQTVELGNVKGMAIGNLNKQLL